MWFLSLSRNAITDDEDIFVIVLSPCLPHSTFPLFMQTDVKKDTQSPSFDNNYTFTLLENKIPVTAKGKRERIHVGVFDADGLFVGGVDIGMFSCPRLN